MKLMLCVYLPLLPLEALRPRWSEPGAYVVVHDGVVCSRSLEAAQAGVHVGMRAAGAAAVAPSTIQLERKLDLEQQRLDAVAMALMQYTPEVTFLDAESVLLDVTASLRLFNGPVEICHRVIKSVSTLGFNAQLGAAPTAKAAWLFARQQRVKQVVLRRRALSNDTTERFLNRLQVELLPSTRQHHAWFDGIGARSLGALRRLPRAGLIRRTSKDLVHDLDCAYGLTPELHKWIQTPDVFSARIETFERVEHADALLDGAKGLLLQLIGWLTSRQLAVRRFTLALEHERGRAAVAPTLLEVALAEPAWRDEHLVRLLKERLAKTELKAPVIAVRLEANDAEPMLPANATLFPEPGGTPADFRRLLELLTARVGADNVMVPTAVDDYRPEVCNSWTAATAKLPKADSADIQEGRPFWMLKKPIALVMRNERPFYGSELRMMSGPERLEAGWWNDELALRDYYVAQAADGTCYWVYLERTAEARWYLHGLFA
ncbi:DNA polymerase Y family protein [Massilia sp. 9096]|uniref:Y-family DNA polymerase n=1 Tax=Massilia sp. 9096 TaxID=1500894 RepID=UPI00055AF0F7|nr:DNA polymerase Y family protein [Massilia sp. 9096]